MFDHSPDGAKDIVAARRHRIQMCMLQTYKAMPGSYMISDLHSVPGILGLSNSQYIS